LTINIVQLEGRRAKAIVSDQMGRNFGQVAHIVGRTKSFSQTLKMIGGAGIHEAATDSQLAAMIHLSLDVASLDQELELQCLEVIKRHGVRSSDDWQAIEAAGLAPDVLRELSAIQIRGGTITAAKLSTLQMARLRLSLQGRPIQASSLAPPSLSQKQAPASSSASGAAGAPSRSRTSVTICGSPASVRPEDPRNGGGGSAPVELTAEEARAGFLSQLSEGRVSDVHPTYSVFRARASIYYSFYASWNFFSLATGALVPFYYSQSWLHSLVDSRDAIDLRTAIVGSSELVILVNGLLIGTSFDIAIADASIHGMETWFDVALSVLDLNMVWCSYVVMVWELAILYIITPVSDANLKTIIRGNTFLIWVSKMYLLALIYTGCFVLTAHSFTPFFNSFTAEMCQDDDDPSANSTVSGRMLKSSSGSGVPSSSSILPFDGGCRLPQWALSIPGFFSAAHFAVACALVMYHINVASRMAAHSGAMGVARVLPPGSNSWADDRITTYLAWISQANTDLKALYQGSAALANPDTNSFLKRVRKKAGKSSLTAPRRVEKMSSQRRMAMAMGGR